MALRLHHIAIQSDSIKNSIDWYTKHLQASILTQDEDWAMLIAGNTRIALTKTGTHPDHVCFLVDSLEDFPCDKIDIKEHRDGSLYYYQQAPDGNVIEWLFWPK